ncbi:Nitrilase/cyanide hydratase and apolipoprotein N- acyltransferase [Cellulomonas flavigena DSM 20109]|uniref:Nitrilase/cyanide hydratase and apolipoprotein N-acyltransferase n=1 Tax=Cellulomonas flavigena (strain ATCC 482 / DSM 20109 / BCRC 11376 / JCM 18109 / NBRC 3775 / NCIMB 8073 / NRS 134) TaxID=446466 RepID=D5UKN4_CELFN|nr:carbon-nitrogen hydrolase family protein [Cellulomonas flavigena]ADG73852.1 Nitrilase/cyanide hydratase and apolipoprotein N- acyltransferase [Cellulomonas flavigena DSM 20109]
MTSRPEPPVRPAVRVTLAQLSVGPDREANVLVARDALRTAARARADVVVLPEYASAFDPRGVGIELAEPLDGPFVSALRADAAAHGLTVVAGTTLPGGEPGPDGRPRGVNAVVAVAPTGEIAGVYRKVHLYDAFGQRESERLAPGPADAPPLVVEAAGLRFGVLTCYDLRFPESARRLVDAGADVLVVPAAWAAGPLKAMHWRALAVARAIENTAAVVAVGQAGKGVVGRSLVVGPDGVVGLEADEEPQVRTVDLDADEMHAVRERNPSLTHRRYAVVPRD